MKKLCLIIPKIYHQSSTKHNTILKKKSYISQLLLCLVIRCFQIKRFCTMSLQNFCKQAKIFTELCPIYHAVNRTCMRTKFGGITTFPEHALTRHSFSQGVVTGFVCCHVFTKRGTRTHTLLVQNTRA